MLVNSLLGHLVINYTAYLQDYGIDWNGPVVTALDDDVQIPSTDLPLSIDQVDQLRQAVNPLAACEDYGISMYTSVRCFVHACVT